MSFLSVQTRSVRQHETTLIKGRFPWRSTGACYGPSFSNWWHVYQWSFNRLGASYGPIRINLLRIATEYKSLSIESRALHINPPGTVGFLKGVWISWYLLRNIRHVVSVFIMYCTWHCALFQYRQSLVIKGAFQLSEVGESSIRILCATIS